MLILAKRKSASKRKPRIKLRPGYSGRMEQIATEVDDPYERGQLHAVVVNIRESELAVMFNRGHLGDKNTGLAQSRFMAGDWIRRKVEQTRMSSGAVDPSNEPVDQSGHADPIPERVIAAAQALGPVERHVTGELGRQGWITVRLVCGEGATVKQAANRRYGFASRAEERATGQLLKDALDEAAVYLGYAQKRKCA